MKQLCLVKLPRPRVPQTREWVFWGLKIISENESQKNVGLLVIWPSGSWLFLHIVEQPERVPRKQAAARMHSFYSVITFHATDNPLHGQQLQTQAGKRGLLRSNPGPAGPVSSENRKPAPPGPGSSPIEEVWVLTPPPLNFSKMSLHALHSKIPNTHCSQALCCSRLF